MRVEPLLDWAVKILDESEIALSSKILSERLNQQFQASLTTLDILLSLDKRYSRDQEGNWRLSKNVPEKAEIDNIVIQAINIRQQAIYSLQSELQHLYSRISIIDQELSKINSQLDILGYRGNAQLIKSRTPKSQRIPADISERRYKSLWPLPGGRVKFLGTLQEILTKIAEGYSTGKLVEWAKEKYQIGDWAEHAIINCVIYPGLAMRAGNVLDLSEHGRQFLETENPTIVGKCMINNIWGIQEMLGWIAVQPLTLDELLVKFNELGAGWDKTHQVRYRLDWMITTGFVFEDKKYRPKRYRTAREE